ncbi:hypothetical protein RJ639_000222 [Escallonia herrerae]|uniref:Glycoside hydrolase family 38 N-terminal domain-containing protein n=1 Tax=Escallonia herrerae TaxID=1293975 RepID=A0AA88X9V7_9ASTE|nr:hypothetical protein RJ639_000222 [Escallonia herrerae]
MAKLNADGRPSHAPSQGQDFTSARQSVVHGKLNVHLVPHTHDDVGWKKTIDQYYVGSNYFIQAFFQLWWRDQSEAVKNTVKQLVSSGEHYSHKSYYVDYGKGFRVSICSDMVPEYGQANSLC